MPASSKDGLLFVTIKDYQDFFMFGALCFTFFFTEFFILKILFDYVIPYKPYAEKSESDKNLFISYLVANTHHVLNISAVVYVLRTIKCP